MDSGRKSLFGNIHYASSLLLALALLPALRRFNLPTHFDWPRLISAYWLVLAAQSIFVASLLYLLGFPKEQTRPVLRRLGQDRTRVVFILAFFMILAWVLTWMKALILTVDTIALLELRERIPVTERIRVATSIMLPALYFFVGFLLVFSYNDIILSWRFYGAADGALNRIDAWLMHGATVCSMCYWAVRVFPVWFFRFLEFVYFGMFAQIGAALLLTSLRYGSSRGLHLVGTILSAYYMALILFSLWPSQGPYYLCPTHFSQFPNVIQAFAIQKQLLANSQALSHHTGIRTISADYYIAFPCMHIAQPLIAMWFLRRWKVISAVLAAYNVVLVVAIVLLEWHYVVDLVGGALVAGCAIALVDGRKCSPVAQSLLRSSFFQ